MFRTFLDGQPPVGSDIGRTSDRNFPKVAPLGPTVMELSMVGCLRHPLTRHMSLAVAGTGGYRNRSNTKYIEWWHQTKKTACESVNLFQRYKLLKSVTGSGWVGLSWVGSGWIGSGRVGLGRAYLDFCDARQENSLRALCSLNILLSIQTAPMFLMTLHSCLPSYISHFVHFSIYTKSLHWCCWMVVPQAPHFTL